MSLNLLDYNSCTIPVPTVDQDIDIFDEKYEPMKEKDKEVADGCKFTYAS